MKKFLVIILACICALTLFGCTDKNEANNNEENSNETDNNETDNNEIDYDNPNGIVFTAKEPLCAEINPRDKIKFYELEAQKGESPLEAYETFTDYYNEDIKDKIDGKFYLLKPCDRSYECNYRFGTWYKFYAEDLIDGKYVNPCIKFYSEINKNDFDSLRDDNDSEQNQSRWEDKDLKSSFILDLIIYPNALGANESEENDIKIEFGNNGDWDRTYINIFSGEKCFATCYYYYSILTGNEPWTEEWFENYFKNYLILQV